MHGSDGPWMLAMRVVWFPYRKRLTALPTRLISRTLGQVCGSPAFSRRNQSETFGKIDAKTTDRASPTPLESGRIKALARTAVSCIFPGVSRRSAGHTPMGCQTTATFPSHFRRPLGSVIATIGMAGSPRRHSGSEHPEDSHSTKSPFC